MSSSVAPLFPQTPVFIPSFWSSARNQVLTEEEADARYLRFPIGQGTESIPNLIVSGSSTLGSVSVSSLSGGQVIATTYDALPIYTQTSTLQVRDGYMSFYNADNPYTKSTLFQITGGKGTIQATASDFTFTTPPLITSAPSAGDFTTKVPTTSWVNTYINSSVSPMKASTGLSGGIIAYTIDPYSCLSNTSIGIGFTNFNCIYLPAGSVIAYIVYNLVGVGASNLYRFGLYSGAGALLLETASIGDTTTGVKKVAFTSSYTIPTSGFYYTCVMLLSGTSASFNSCGTVNIRDYSNYPNNTNQVNNGNLAYFRCCQNLTAISSPTALPTSFSAITLTPYYITFSFGLTSS